MCLLAGSGSADYNGDNMTDHQTDMQAVLEIATAKAKEQPTAANIAAMEKARKALADLSSNVGGEKFKNQAAALEYLQRNWKIEKSKLSKDVSAGRCPRKDGYFHAVDLDFYAAAVSLPARTTTVVNLADGGERLKNAMAEEREIKVAQLRGDLINAAEEEARDARLWAAVKADLENHAPQIVNELINRVVSIVDDEQIRQRIHMLAHDLRMQYEDAIADIFDRYAKDGGIEA